MGGTHDSKVCEKNNGGGEESPGKKVAPEDFDREVYNSLQREMALIKLQIEPIEDETEKQVRLVQSILRMNISTLGATIRDSGPGVKEERKAALHRLIKKASDFQTAKHTSDTINEAVKNALEVLSGTFTVFGPEWTSIRDSTAQLALEMVVDLEKKEPLQQEKEELEKMEKRAKKVQEREAMERKEKEKAERDKKKNKKKNKKSKQAQLTNEYDKLNDDFGDERVPPQLTSCAHHACRCQHHNAPEPQYEVEMMMASSDPGIPDYPDSPDLSVRNGNMPQASTRSASVTSAYSSSDTPAISRIMTPDQWSQFCRIYDRGTKK